MKITLEFLEDHNACEDGVEFFKENYKDGIEDKELILSLLDKRRESYANWLLTRLFNKEQCIKYAIFAAELVLHIFEDKHPNDKRPREAIEAAKNYLVNPSNENRIAANYASHAADTAANDNSAYDANDARSVACASVCVAGAASVADATSYYSYIANCIADANAANAIRAASAARDVADYAASTAIWSDFASINNDIYKKIINYGLQLLGENNVS